MTMKNPDPAPLPHTTVTSRHGRKGFELDPSVLNDTTNALSFLRTRRSADVARMGPPGPTADELSLMLEIASRAPDHGKLEPWRFIVLQGAGKAAFAEHVRELWDAMCADARQGKKPLFDMIQAVPLAIFVIARPRPHPKIHQWEQLLCVGAVCQNLLAAATAMDYAAQWRTGWLATDERVTRLLGLEDGESVAGVFYIGSIMPGTPPLQDRRRPFWRDLTTFWEPPTA